MKVIPRSLTSRLVVTTVALVAVVGIMVGLAATLAMRSYLYDRLDNEVTQALRGPQLGARVDDGSGATSSGGGFFRPGALTVTVPAGSTTARAVITTDGGEFQTLPLATVQRLVDETSDEPTTVSVAGDSYRVAAGTDRQGNFQIVGLPTDDISSTLSKMITWFTLLTLVGVLAAGFAGIFLVRRQLRPLRAVADAAREVATQDLTTGDTEISTRVSPELTDPETEVGQVGSALNTLLDHVDDALSARHRSEQQVRQFVADASHELRTPLSTIHGYAELSRRTPDDPEVLGVALNKVETEAGRMSGLVEDLLLLARLDAGRPLAAEEVDLTRLLLEAVADARVLAPEHHWRFDLPDEPIILVGDEDRIHQVATNLLTNARNHTPAGTTVTIAAIARDGEVVFTVHDDGPGLPAELLAEAFDRFTRGDSSRTRASGGSGLGLSLVDAIAAAHQGTATVVSEPGSTTFSVTLPAT